MFESEQEKIRIDKLNKLKAQGIVPYPYKFEISHPISTVRANSADLISGQSEVQIAGRLIGIRKHGKATFADIRDSSDKMQLYFKSNVVGDKYELLELLDIGDFIGVKGTVFVTHMGEVTILVQGFTLLSKSLHPLPEKWHGLQEVELRYRKRWLDLIMNPDIKLDFIRRSKLISTMRTFLDSKGFIEVETPVLQPIYGGAFATPFKSYYKSLDRDFYLRISDELYLKQLIVGGFDKVYEFCKDFRNEGMDRLHNPEFTQLELYQAYADYEDMMLLVEDLFDVLSDGKEIEYQGTKISFKRPWRRLAFFDGLKEYVGEELSDKEDADLVKLAESKGITVTRDYYRGKILACLFDVLVQPYLIEPTFVIDYPKDISPLAKERRQRTEDRGQNLVERFEPFICGIEIGNSFSELNDPLEQVARFKLQGEAREKGDIEAQVLDEGFIESLAHGMPPTGGLGLGIDRIVMLFTNSHSIKDVLLFPQMRI
ncbi:MAG: lysine--tRNA ligase [Candidatus Stahlbacteria bacterium]|nr:lysine--tRNA ligase [Candidatus Stahlbacteria bacterium]